MVGQVKGTTKEYRAHDFIHMECQKQASLGQQKAAQRLPVSGNRVLGGAEFLWG